MLLKFINDINAIDMSKIDKPNVVVVFETTPTIGKIRSIKTKNATVVFSPKLFKHGSRAFSCVDKNLKSSIYATFSQATSLVHVDKVEELEAAYLINKGLQVIKEAFLHEMADKCRLEDVDFFQAVEYTDDNVINNIINCTTIPDTDCSLVLDLSTSFNTNRSRIIFDSIVSKTCECDYDKLRSKNYLVVGVGTEFGSRNYIGSQILEIIHYMKLEGAKLAIFDLFIETFNQLPIDLDFYDHILVFYPYQLSSWKNHKSVLYFCRHI